ncbi:hypothetical protein HL658_02720 [Azospirillum sp. RWY-5-1]|uniref:Uncharacterized protein n=1 Tax=Azospirillum oleiclasticum TaxID=2735135 RepID=A0ABX2T445_9PROT|nr:hypothetical protein [Azospirillum oleiclasticum]NYZ11449.1 hypothetical protein [Azospirillum oleiclasticum]NYZ18610.1 hypothetical protein [Azospirillum oleiclasticum]
MRHDGTGAMPSYVARYDFDGWMVIDAALRDGQPVQEALRRGLSFAEAELSAAFFSCVGVRHPANKN